MKILLGGVPFGCNNIGDEAILSAVCQIFRRNFPDAQLFAASGDEAAACDHLGIGKMPLFGFDSRYGMDLFEAEIKNFDLYVWAGATGLSDYPDMGCSLLEAAQRQGVPCVIWQVGMNDRFNPAYFELRGLRRNIARIFGGVHFHEARMRRRIRRRLAGTLSKCALVALRDEASLRELRKCAPFPDAISGADSAMLLESPPYPVESSPENPRIGVCISAQNELSNLADFARFLDTLCEKRHARIILIPMNPVTDRALLEQLQALMRHQELAELFPGETPSEVQSVASSCRLIISSRLHLMILGLNKLVPAIGIARGSKIATFLDAFMLPTVGSTDHCDFAKLLEESEKLLDQHDQFQQSARLIRRRQLDKLAIAEEKLAQLQLGRR